MATETAHLSRGQIAQLVAGVDGPNVARFLAQGRDRRIASGEAFLSQGEPSKFVFDILSGAAVLERSGVDGRRQVFAFVFENNITGVSVAGVPHYSAIAVSELVVRSYPRAALEALLIEEPRVAVAYASVLTRMLRSAHDLIFAIGRKSAVERAAAFLLHIRDHRARFGGGPPANLLDLPMTRADIADFLGLTVESVSRCFADLKRRGLVSLDHPRQVRLLDVDRLRALVEIGDFANRTNAD